jgi:hypothetical protein
MLAYTLLFAGQHTRSASGLAPFKVAKAVLDQLGVEQGRRSALVYHLEAMEAQHRERFKDKPNRPSPLRPRTLILLLLLEVRSGGCLWLLHLLWAQITRLLHSAAHQ